MTLFASVRRITLASVLWAGRAAAQTAPPVPPALSGAGTAAGQTPAANLPSELASQFSPRTDSFDYIKRTAMIPMRDGVKLYTVILIPRGAARAPILLTRTPYGADDRIAKHGSAHLATLIGDGDVADDEMVNGDYIRVFQDIRGKHRSEGDYVMTRPLQGPLNPTKVDHATDTYDTIDWLVKNTPESNGRVGMLGISYDGFTTLMGLVHPHPALKCAVPINPMVDGWMGDDWFHNGAFRQDSLKYAYDQESTRESSASWWSDHYDDYQSWLDAGNAHNMAVLHGADQAGFTQKLFAHPAYDAFWQNQAMDKILAREPLRVPVMLVGSLWDQEDIYGAVHVFRALKPLDVGGDKVFMVLGPWFHHQQRLDGSAIGDIRFGADTAQFFRLQLLRPFFDHFLKDAAPPARIFPVVAYETGTNRWTPLPNWPAGSPRGDAAPAPQKLYLHTGGGLGFDAPADAQPGYTAYVADPAKPVPFLPRPVHLEGEAGEAAWQTWLVSDQRPAASRTDVLTYETAPLTAPLKIAGEPAVHLNASTTGTDGDFVVKLIDVYPEEMGREPQLGGYQLMVSGDIFRGRYRGSLEKPSAIPAGEKQAYGFSLPDANHVFLKGHRIMVQVQSSWFPLYDRNPQTYVDNIFFATPDAYKAATIHVFDAGADASFLELPVVKGQ
jgi:putative CocE/NonD family hydrolase